MKKNIYITGLGFYTPLGYGQKETLKRLRNGESGLKVKSLWDGIEPCLIGELPDVSFDEHIDWKEPFRPTPYSQILILSCYDAVMDALINENDIKLTGCIMETCLGPSENVNEYMKDLLLIKKGHHQSDEIHTYGIKYRLRRCFQIFQAQRPQLYLADRIFCKLCVRFDSSRHGRYSDMQRY